MDLQPGREGEVEAMVVVADDVEVVSAATGEREREGTLERGGHGVDLGFRCGEKERVEWKAEVADGYEVEEIGRASCRERVS